MRVTFDPVGKLAYAGFLARVRTHRPYAISGGTCKFLLVEPRWYASLPGVGGPQWYTWCSVRQRRRHLIYYATSTAAICSVPTARSLILGNVNKPLAPTSIRDRNATLVRSLINLSMNSLLPPLRQRQSTTSLIVWEGSFNSTTNRRQLTTITEPDLGTAQNPDDSDIAQFDYQTRALSYSFSGSPLRTLVMEFSTRCATSTSSHRHRLSVHLPQLMG